MKNLLKRITVIVLLLSLLSSGGYLYKAKLCQNENLPQIYIMAFEQVISLDESLHGEKEYFALNTETLKNLDDDEKQEVMQSLNMRYEKELVDASYLDLLNEGKEKRFEELSCLILYIEEVEDYGVFMRVHVGKEYGSLGANGIIVDFYYLNGEWRFLRYSHSWVA